MHHGSPNCAHQCAMDRAIVGQRRPLRWWDRISDTGSLSNTIYDSKDPTL